MMLTTSDLDASALTISLGCQGKSIFPRNRIRTRLNAYIKPLLFPRSYGKIIPRQQKLDAQWRLGSYFHPDGAIAVVEHHYIGIPLSGLSRDELEVLAIEVP
jgi:hypothetical protein